MIYSLRNADWHLKMDSNAISTLSGFQQTGMFSREKMGQLFSTNLLSEEISIKLVTNIKPVRSSRTEVKFDPSEIQKEREELFEQGLHCVGLWHTHPEPIPTPSGLDEALAKDYALAAQQDLKGIVFAIVGTAPFPFGLAMWVHDGKTLHKAYYQDSLI